MVPKVTALPAGLAESFLDRPFVVNGPEAFNALTMDLFRMHAEHNAVYREYIAAVGVGSGKVQSVAEIPCLPITLFRSQRVLRHGLDPRFTFTRIQSSGSRPSQHHVPWPEVYERSFFTSFKATYGDPTEWRILALLPSYLERSGSSLVYMAEKLIAASSDPLSGTYLNKLADLADVLRRSEAEGRKTLLLGVPFALLDLAEQHPMPLRHTTIMETGGMKGRRPEMVREELHRILCAAFGVKSIHSEYGMTELLSQAWSRGEGRYRCPPWMQVRLRDVNDPFASVPDERTGGINVIDLANIGSCPFISTQDLGRRHADGSIEVLGRFDNSDLRGCNLMVGI